MNTKTETIGYHGLFGSRETVKDAKEYVEMVTCGLSKKAKKIVLKLTEDLEKAMTKDVVTVSDVNVTMENAHIKIETISKAERIGAYTAYHVLGNTLALKLLKEGV